MTHRSSPPAPMTLPERLRAIRFSSNPDDYDAITIEAAAEIDALTARVAELERDNADVLKLGDEFGFEDRPFSVSQVLTHARYLQSERARLLFESVTLKAELAAARGALEIIAGRRQCIDNLMSDKEVALAALGDMT